MKWSAGGKGDRGAVGLHKGSGKWGARLILLVAASGLGWGLSSGVIGHLGLQCVLRGRVGEFPSKSILLASCKWQYVSPHHGPTGQANSSMRVQSHAIISSTSTIPVHSTHPSPLFPIPLLTSPRWSLPHVSAGHWCQGCPRQHPIHPARHGPRGKEGRAVIARVQHLFGERAQQVGMRKAHAILLLHLALCEHSCAWAALSGLCQCSTYGPNRTHARLRLPKDCCCGWCHAFKLSKQRRQQAPSSPQMVVVHQTIVDTQNFRPDPSPCQHTCCPTHSVNFPATTCPCFCPLNFHSQV